MSLEGFGSLVMLKQVPTLLHPQGSFSRDVHIRYFFAFIR